MASTVADHKQSRYDTGACGALRDVQVDHQFARAVGIDMIGARLCAGLTCWRRELGWNAVAGVATLGEIALAVEKPDAGYDLWRTIRKTWRSVRGDPVRVFALQGRVRALEIVSPPAQDALLSQSKLIVAGSTPLRNQLFTSPSLLRIKWVRDPTPDRNPH